MTEVFPRNVGGGQMTSIFVRFDLPEMLHLPTINGNVACDFLC